MIYKEGNIVSKGLCGLRNCAFLIKMSNHDLLSYENNACKIAI